MSTDTLLSRLDKVRGTRSGWSACCPAHEDRSPSLSVAETSDGTVLVRCFAGCSASDIVAAVGLNLSDLFPVRAITDYADERQHRTRSCRRPFDARSILRCVAHELRIASIVLHDIEAGIAPSHEDLRRFALAVSRVQEAEAIANG